LHPIDGKIPLSIADLAEVMRKV